MDTNTSGFLTLSSHRLYWYHSSLPVKHSCMFHKQSTETPVTVRNLVGTASLSAWSYGYHAQFKIVDVETNHSYIDYEGFSSESSLHSLQQ